MPEVFHEGEQAVQQRAGVTEQAAKVGRSVQTILPPGVNEYLGELPFVIVASVDAAGQPWASIVTGAPGFITGPYPNCVTITSLPMTGDPLREHLRDGVPLGLLAIDLRTRSRLRVNGHAEGVDDTSFNVRVREAFGNCRKYIQKREVTYENRAANDREVDPVVSDRLSTGQRQWIAQADTFFIASSHQQAGVDASHRGGMPGFVHVLDDTRITWRDYPGNNMFQTLGNLAIDPRAGLLFVDFDTGATLQLTGRATIEWNPTRRVTFTIQRVLDRPALPGLIATGCEYSPHNPHDA